MIFFRLLLLSLIMSCGKKIDYSSMKPNLKFGSYSESLFSFAKPVQFSSKEGLERLMRATKDGTAVSFYATVNFYAPQVYPVTCGPASLRVALSSLYVQEDLVPPISKETTLVAEINGLKIPHFVFTEANLFDQLAEKDIARGLKYKVVARQEAGPDGKYSGGVAPVDLALIASSFEPVKVDYYPVISTEFSKAKYQEFRSLVVDTLKDSKKVLIVNYHLAVEIPVTSGHYSPVVAFDKETESVLLLNPMIHYINWNWVSLEDLYKSMNSVINGFDRGYLIVSIKDQFRKKDDKNVVKNAINKKEAKMTEGDKLLKKDKKDVEKKAKKEKSDK